MDFLDFFGGISMESSTPGRSLWNLRGRLRRKKICGFSNHGKPVPSRSLRISSYGPVVSGYFHGELITMIFMVSIFSITITIIKLWLLMVSNSS